MSFNAIITADVKGFSDGVEKAGKDIEKLQLTASEKLAKIGQSFESIGKKASILSAAIVAAGALAVKSFITQEQAERKLDAAISATGGNVEELSERFRKFASDLQGVTTTGDEVTLGMLQMAQTMGLSADQSERAVKNAIAMESAFGVAAESAMRYTAALEDGDATMLKRYIPALKGIEDETLLVAKAQEILGNAFVVAQEDALTFGGQVTQLKNSFGDLMEQFGAIIAEHIKPMIEGFKRLVDGFLEMDEGTKKIIVTIAGVIAAVGPFLLILGKIIALAPLVGSAFTAMTGPVGIAIAAIGLAAAAIIKNWDEIKAYFTGDGGGASTFDAISEAATKVKDSLVKIFTKISEVVTKIWDRFGGYITGVFSGVFDNIMAIVDYFAEQIGNVADFFSAIVDGDFSGALDALGAMFVTAFNGILRIVTNIIGQAANIVAGLFDAIGMEKWAAKTKGFADNMISAYQPVIEQKKEVVKETEKHERAELKVAAAIQKSVTAAEAFAKIPAPEMMAAKGVETAIIPVSLVLPELAPLQDRYQEIVDTTIDFGQILAGATTNLAATIGEAFGSGNFEGLGNGLIQIMADMVSQLGAMLISTGFGMMALQKMITNPFTAIAAGIAMVALGAAASASAQKTVSKITGGGASTSAGGTNSYNQTSRLGDSSYRGAYKDDWNNEVVFKIGNNELVGTLQKADNRRERL